MDTKIVLIVDDVRFSLEHSKSYFETTNYSVLTAMNGEEGLDIIKKERPSLVLTDLYMPVMNGDEMCGIIKKDPFLRNIPVIMFTSSGSEEDKRSCFDAGCDDYIKKPILSLVTFFNYIKKFVPDITYREYLRVSIDANISYQFNGKEYSGKISNVSEGGLFIEGAIHLTGGDKIDIQFRIPVLNRLVEAKGSVARIIKPRVAETGTEQGGAGICFLHVELDGRRAISEYVRSQSKG